MLACELLCSPGIEFEECPDCHRADKRRGIVEQPLRLPRKRWIAGIANSDQHVAYEAIPADSLDRRAAEERTKIPVGKLRQIGKTRLRELGADVKSRLARGTRELIPRTDCKAIVAAIDAIAYVPAELARNVPLMLDSEIGNAAACVDSV